MKVVILAGGLGSRLSEETQVVPKPMVTIGGKPIILYLMKQYAAFGFTDFLILGGYKVDVIKRYFHDLHLHVGNLSIDISTGTNLMTCETRNWKITILDTGEYTLTGSRLLKAKEFLKDEFLLTYGDGVSDVSLDTLISFHREKKATVTLTKVNPPNQFGRFTENDENKIIKFHEKTIDPNQWINGGFYVCSPGIWEFFDQDGNYTLEDNVLTKVSSHGGLFAYRHEGFWKCMDTMKDKIELEELIKNGKLQF